MQINSKFKFERVFSDTDTGICSTVICYEDKGGLRKNEELAITVTRNHASQVCALCSPKSGDSFNDSSLHCCQDPSPNLNCLDGDRAWRCSP